MLRRFIVAAASTAVLFAAGSAGAQDLGKGFGSAGQIILSADRLAPLFAYSNNKTTDNSTNPATSQSTTTTQLALLPSFNDLLFNGNFYNVPRVGFDYVVVDHVTVGADVGVEIGRAHV